MRLTSAFAGLALAMTFGASAANAIPLAKPVDTAAAGVATEVEKIHGWHSYCARGPARWHRHVPGAGNVPCAPVRTYRAPYYGPRVIIVPRHRPRAYW